MINFSKVSSRLPRAIATAVAGICALAAGTVGAQTITFPTSPLYLNSGVQSNVMVSIDNSGSTDWEVAELANNGAAWWNPGGGSFVCQTIGFSGCGTSGGADVVSAGTLNFNTFNSGQFTYFTYLFPNGDRDMTLNPGGRLYQDTDSIYAIPPFPAFAWARSAHGSSGSNGNGMYFDPEQTYSHWPSDGSTTFTDATATAARMEATSTTGTVDLTSYTAGSTTSGISADGNSSTGCYAITASGTATDWGFRMENNMVVPAGTCAYVSYKTCHTISSGHCTSYNSTTNGWLYFSNPVTVGGGTTVIDSATSLSSDSKSQATTSISNGTTVAIAYYPATFYVPHGTDLSALGYNAATLTGTAPDGTAMDGYEIKSANFTNTTSYNTAIQNFANWFVYYRKRYLAIRAGVALSFDPIKSVYAGFFTINSGTDNSSTYYAWSTSHGGNLTMDNLATATGSASKASFFDSIYGYSRGAWGTPNREAVDFMGSQLRRTDASAPIQYKCQQNFTMLFTDGYSMELDSDQGGFVDQTTIADSSGDGSISTSGAGYFEHSTTNPNNDSTSPPTYLPYPDVVNESAGGGVGYTMADRTMYDYSTALRSDSPNFNNGNADQVPVPSGCGSANGGSGSTAALYPIPYSALDCNPQLHAVFYGIILNSEGFVYGVNNAATTDPYANPPSSGATYPPAAGSSSWTWPTAASMTDTNYSPSAIDDMWHATVNSRGKMFNATDTADIVSDLKAVLADIIQRTSSSSSIAVTSSNIITGSDAFEATFNSTSWTGDLEEFQISDGTATSGACLGVSIGSVCTSQAIWSAASQLGTDFHTSQANRFVLTYDGVTASGYTPTYKGIVFNATCGSSNFSSTTLTSPMQTLLNIDGGTLAADANGCLRVSYLRGDQTQEASGKTPLFRTRTSLLGDIIDSNPYYVGPPSTAYAFGHYSDFAATYASREPVIYVGANDGMLHGFETSGGTSGGHEVLAYIPSKAFGTASNPLLAKLTSPNYTHEYIVDGSPIVGDAQLGTSGTATDWHTVLVGTMGYGGQSVYALDVTNPANFTTTNAASLVMWEFNDTDDPNLGNVFGQPSIVKMHDGNWWAIINGGYNATTADGNASTTGHGALFMLRLNHTSGSAWTKGTDYIRIDMTADGGTVSSPNGLSTPAVVDVDGDGVADRIYAGDLKGNMWRFDVTSATPGSWAIGNGGVPLFTARDSSGNVQPITDQPEIGTNLSLPTDLNVYFGTGRYLDAGDNITTGQATQTMYAIFDENKNTTITRTTLLQQTITSQKDANGTACTSSTTADLCYRTTSSNSLNVSTQNGWYLDLYVNSSNNGERIVQSPQLYNGLIVFETLIPDPTPCSYGGSGWIMYLNETTGLPPTQSTFNINGGATSGQGSTVGIPGGMVITNNGQTGSNGQAFGQTMGTNGTSESPPLPSGQSTGRISWRELGNN